MNKTLYKLLLYTGLLYTIGALSFAQSPKKDSLYAWNTKANQLASENIFSAYKLAYRNYELLSAGTYDDELTAEVYFTLSQIYNGLTEYSLAIQFGLEAINMFEASKQTSSLIAAYNSLGGIFYNTFNYDRTIQFTQKAIQLADEKRMTDQLPSLYNNLSGAYRQKKAFKEALKYAHLALNRTDSLSKQKIATVLGTIGEVHYDLKQYDSAFHYFNQALLKTYEAKVYSPLVEVSILSNLAKSYLAVGDLKAALIHAKKSYNLAEKAGFIHFERELTQLLSSIYKLCQLPDSAVIFIEKFKLLDKEIWNDEKERQMNNVVIKVRERELQEKKLLVEQQRWILFLGILLLIVFIGILIALLFFIRKRNKLYLTIKHQKEEIEKKNKELEAYHLVKDKIFSTVIHDFKTPLNSIEAMLGLLEKQGLSYEHLSKLSSRLKVNLTASKQSVNNLILWAKNQMEGIQPTYELVDLKKLITKIKQYHELSLLQKEIKLKIDSHQNSFFYTDKEILFISINNILSNAIKFSTDSSTIKLDLKIKDKSLHISITDQGIGINPAELNDIFSVTSISKKGSGIGLAVTKDLLSKINGTISIDSQVGVGTTFTFIIPSSFTE